MIMVAICLDHQIISLIQFYLSPQDLLDEITSKRSFIITAEDNSKFLIRNLPEDETIRPALREELSKVYAPLEGVEEKLRERKAKLLNVLVEEQETKPAFDSLVDSLSSVETRVSREKPLSAVWQELSEQVQDQKVGLNSLFHARFVIMK